jgi:hypothetical protein
MPDNSARVAHRDGTSLNFVCPVCGAQPGGKCKLRTGGPRLNSHFERLWIARDHELGPEATEPPLRRVK